MILPDFSYYQPTSLEEAAELLREHGPNARLVGGGTDLFPNMKNNLVFPEAVISLRGVPVAEPEVGPDGSLRVDAGMLLADIAESPLVRERAPLLAESALEVASNQIRQMGTLGGNLCQESRCLQYNQSHEFQFLEPCYKLGGDCCFPYPGADKSCWSVFMSDTAPALLCLDARLELLGRQGQRTLELGELYSHDGLRPLTLGADEILARVIIPGPAPGTGTAFRKHTQRGGLDFAIVAVAVLVTLAPDGDTCGEVRIFVGSVSTGPVRAPGAEAELVGKKPDASRMARAALKASEEIRPIPHHGYSLGFLKHNIRVFTERALTAAVNNAKTDGTKP